MAERGSTATLHPIHTVHGARDLESTVAQGFVKHGFKVMLHRVVDGPFASFTLSGFTNPVRLHPVYPCILGLKEPVPWTLSE